MNTLESLLDSILKMFPTQSVTMQLPFSALSGPTAAKEVMIILPMDGNIVVNKIAFTCLGKMPYTFKNIADLRTITSTVGGSAIYYPAFSAYTNITPNNQ